MLNIGIIGNTEVLEPHVKRIQKNKNVNVIGKASVGTSAQLNGFHFSIPEFNRIELIERADILLVDSSSLLPFDMLCDIVKKSKHIFATEYLKLKVDECDQLERLASESGSVVQVINPYLYTPAVQWLNKKFSAPLYFDVSKFAEELSLKEIMYPLFLMLSEITGLNPKKIGVSAFKNSKDETNFTNIRLEFMDASVVNLNFGNSTLQNGFQIKGFCRDQFVLLDVENETCNLNGENCNFDEEIEVNELDIFVEAIVNKGRRTSNLEDYRDAVELGEIIEKKIIQFVV